MGFFLSAIVSMILMTSLFGLGQGMFEGHISAQDEHLGTHASTFLQYADFAKQVLMDKKNTLPSDRPLFVKDAHDPGHQGLAIDPGKESLVNPAYIQRAGFGNIMGEDNILYVWMKSDEEAMFQVLNGVRRKKITNIYTFNRGTCTIVSHYTQSPTNVPASLKNIIPDQALVILQHPI